MLAELEKGRCVVGLKQTVRALKSGDVAVVVLAEDADDRVKQQVFNAIGESDVHLVFEGSMLELGAACGIDVGAAVVSVLRD